VSWGQIYLLSNRALKTLCVVLGVFFLGIAAHVWLQGELQKNGAELLVLIPLLSGIVLLGGAAMLKLEALRTLVLAWFVLVPAVLYAVGWIGCEAKWFSESFCQ
jgi:hypothetical protein